MSFVNRSGGEQRRQTQSASGAPPADDFDPADPDVVKVHYDVTGWTFDQRAELTEVLAEAGLPHAWDGDELVVPEAAEGDADVLFGRLEEQLGPFAVALADDEPATEFLLDEWPPADLELLRASLVDAEIPHRWDGPRIFVATDADDIVDDLLDAIERGDIASYDDTATDGPPDGALGRLYTIGDRLARDAAEAGARAELFDLVPHLDARTPPFGLAVRPWASIVAAVQALVDDFDTQADESEVIGHAEGLRTITRPYV
ncbi:MAG: hypothetical protein WD225_13860 [Ilumatobacteraceae bacterium]